MTGSAPSSKSWGWATGEKQRCFGHYWYAADSWKRMLRVIAKAEVRALGENPRYVVTNLDGDARQLYGQAYCARGEMENRIKECQLGLFAYSPELNPDEYLNCDLKAQVHCGKPAKNRDELETRVRGVMMKLQHRPERVKSYFKHVKIQYAA